MLLEKKKKLAFVSRRHQSDGLLGGPPQLKANLRGCQSPHRQTAKSSLEEDLKKLITLDSPPPTTTEEKVQRNAFLFLFLMIFVGEDQSEGAENAQLAKEITVAALKWIINVCL